MKNIALLILILLTIETTQAQNKKGNVLIGVTTLLGKRDVLSSHALGELNGFGSISYKNDSSGYVEPEADKYTRFGLRPTVGYLITDKLVAGLDMLYSYRKSENPRSNFNQITKLYAAGPFIRYYLPVHKVLPYFELNGSVGKATIRGSSDITARIITYGGGIGIAAPLSKRITFDAFIEYYIQNEKEEENRNDIRAITKVLGLEFGFTIFLGKMDD